MGNGSSSSTRHNGDVKTSYPVYSEKGQNDVTSICEEHIEAPVRQISREKPVHYETRETPVRQKSRENSVNIKPEEILFRQNSQETLVSRKSGERSMSQKSQEKPIQHESPETSSRRRSQETLISHKSHRTYSRRNSQETTISLKSRENSVHDGPYQTHIRRKSQETIVSQKSRENPVYDGPYQTHIRRNSQETLVSQKSQDRFLHHKSLQTPLSVKSRDKSFSHESQGTYSSQKSREKSMDRESEEEDTGQLTLNRLTLPIHIFHLKAGSTLCSNDNMILLQDGSTTIEFILFPTFQVKRIPWRFGLIRDIIWSSELERFILLTRNALYNVNPEAFLIPEKVLNKPITSFTINTYNNVKPYTNNALFWRCTCVGTTLYIVYSGSGGIIDEYTLTTSTSEFVKRWVPPKTCAKYEGIWCIRHHPDTDQIGMSIIDTRNEQWRMEVRSLDKFNLLWQTVLPLTNGDCEISPLPNGEWLTINSCDIRLAHLANQKLKVAVEYERELKNAILFKDLYFIVRTKGTLDIHRIKQPK